MVGADEPQQQWVDVRFVLLTDSTVEPPDTLPHVQALVVGRGREIQKLYEEPPVIRHPVGSDTPELVTLTLTPRDVVLPNDVDARAIDVSPHSLSLAFRVTEERRVPVRSALRVVPDSGLHLVGSPRLEPERVRIRGPRRLVRAITAISTDQATLVIRDTVTVRTVALDTAGLGVQVTPTEVRVRVTAAYDLVFIPPIPGPTTSRGPRDTARALRHP